MRVFNFYFENMNNSKQKQTEERFGTGQQKTFHAKQ